jgi:hypothetical protein
MGTKFKQKNTQLKCGGEGKQTNIKHSMKARGRERERDTNPSREEGKNKSRKEKAREN